MWTSDPTADVTTIADFEEHRRYLTRLAYRMLGTVADAEDVVQDSFLRWQAAGEPHLGEPRAWFARTCTRLCLDRLKATRRQREQYVGEWLPEPLLADDPEDRLELDESLSMALMLTVQRLPPTERAAFLLHDVFGHAFAEVAEILELEVAHCRQLAVRARRNLEGGRRFRATDQETVRRLSAAFFSAVGSGELQQIRSVLADDVVLHSDGGGLVAAARRPVEGAEAVARFFHRIFQQRTVSITVRPLWFNGAPGVVICEDGAPVSAFQFQLDGEQIAGIYVQRNPEKLRELAELEGE